MNNIPSLLKSISGQTIDNVEKWEEYRRDEILNLFKNYVFGIFPIGKPKDMVYTYIDKEREHNIVQRTVTAKYTDYSFKFNVFFPKNNSKKLPAFMLYMHQFAEETCDIHTELENEKAPIRQAIENGYAFVAITNSEICPDVFEKKPFNEGIFTTIKEKNENTGAVISSWVWAGMRVMDYLEIDNNIDNTKVAVIGHSRCGKTALWTGALDKRFALTISNDSGCTGAAILRGKQGEHIRDITEAFDWFCDNYTKYKENEDMLPVDQHMLLSLIAPRPLYVASASLDLWADPDSELLSCKLASEVYELYGKQGVIIDDDSIQCDKSYDKGTIAYHRRTGEHRLTMEDWNMYFPYADKYLK